MLSLIYYDFSQKLPKHFILIVCDHSLAI